MYIFYLHTNCLTYSFSDHCDKVLEESAYGDFSTRPSDIKLYMSDILKHVTSPFPMHLLMFKDTKLPKMLGKDVCVCGMLLTYVMGYNDFPFLHFNIRTIVQNPIMQVCPTIFLLTHY